MSKILDFFAGIIHDELGIVYQKENYYQLESRLRDITSQMGYSSVDALYEEAKSGLHGHLKQLLLDVATNNETSFFRDPRVFNAINKITDEIANKPGRTSPIKIWCAASSTGQEPYSVAMLLKEKEDSLPGRTFRILASDISGRVLEQAKSGLYSQLEVQRGLPALKLALHFEEGSKDMERDPKWRIKSNIKMHIDFKKLNLKHNWVDIDKFDLILCRNVLIYQSIESKRDIVERMCAHIVEGGFLILGGAESLMGITEKLKMVQIAGSTFYSKEQIA